ncbi:MAG: glycerate kinase [Firmicutes bacterium HGW-Firmicutes-21]|nr:MAG: glycerate kinase [Firmicutes bacterium HGW-Firmicutes-21]
MKFIIAIDSYKGSLTSIQACGAAKQAILSVFRDAEIITVPIADGGEGTATAFYHAFGGRMEKVTVTSPDFTNISASYAILPDNTAVIEMAEASGLTLVRGEKNAGEATSLGTGELIRDALGKGCRSFIIGLGGSATNDGGAGALAALGVKFLDKQGNPIKPNGNGLCKLYTIDTDGLVPELAESVFTIACDVENTLCGENGASHIYGEQKGASGNDIIRLDDNLYHYAKSVEKTTGRDILGIKGGGAAGGMCAGLMGFLNAETQSGIKLLLERIKFKELITDADYIFSGEGKADAQTANGKVIIGIADYTKQAGKPLIVVAGQLADGYECIFEKGVTAAFSTTHYAEPFEQIKHRAEKDLSDTVKNICRIIRAVGKI